MYYYNVEKIRNNCVIVSIIIFNIVMGVCFNGVGEVCMKNDSQKIEDELMKIVGDQSIKDDSSALNECDSKAVFRFQRIDSSFSQLDDIVIDNSLHEIINLKYELLNFKLSRIMSTNNSSKLSQVNKTCNSQSIERKPAYIDNKKSVAKEVSERDGYDEFENEEYLPCDDTLNPDYVLLGDILKETLNLKHEELAEEISKKMHFINVIKDFVLFNRKVDFFFVIVSGSIGYFKDGQLQAVYKKGDTFGDLSNANEDKIYDGASVYSKKSTIKWCLKALEDSKIYLIDTKLLNKMIKKNSNKILRNLDVVERIPILRNVTFENKLILAEKIIHQQFVLKDVIQNISEDVKFIFVINEGIVVGKNKFGETHIALQKGDVLNAKVIYTKLEESSYHYVVNSEKCSISSLSINSIAEIFSIKFEEKLLFEIFCRAIEENLFLSKMLRDNKGLKSSSKVNNNTGNLKKMRTDSFNQFSGNPEDKRCSVDLISSNKPFQRPLQKFYTNNYINHQPSKTFNKLEENANEIEIKISRRESNNHSINNIENSCLKSRYLKANLSGSFHSVNLNRSIVSESKFFLQNNNDKKELFELFTLKIIRKNSFNIQKIKDEKLMYLILYGEILDVGVI